MEAEGAEGDGRAVFVSGYPFPTQRRYAMRFAKLKKIPMMLIVGVAATACSPTPPPPPAKPAAAPAPQVVEKPVTPAAAANMASHCLACHGPNGGSPGG